MSVWKCKLYFVFLMSLSLSSGDGLPLEIYVHPVIPCVGVQVPAEIPFYFLFPILAGLTIISCFLFLFFPSAELSLEINATPSPYTSLVA